jgi:DNA topoisomerase-1
MKHVLNSLRHNGVYVPVYDYKRFNIKILGKKIALSPMSEQMAIAWIRKKQSVLSPPDNVYEKNFKQEFLDKLKQENPELGFLDDFLESHLIKIDEDILEKDDIDFSEISNYLGIIKQEKLSLSKAEKKEQTAIRKEIRMKRKEKYGYAMVDGKKLEIANWTSEPSCLFAGRGNHPRRGKWKEGPKQEDIILNLSPESPQPPGNWKDVVWEPEKMYVAKWIDKLTGKIKYVWFSDSAFIKQNREKEKFEKAAKLGKRSKSIEKYIIKNLDAKDDIKRKIATVCWLLLKPNMRVGDEKDPEEADTVGAITLRKEHIRIVGNIIQFDFLGKDSVRWMKSVKATDSVIRNIKNYAESSKEYLFEGVDSKKVSRFLSQKMPGLTAKVFRTWRCTKTLEDTLKKSKVTKDDEIYIKKFHAKIANLKVAEVANHKRKISPKFGERLLKKENKLKELKIKLKEKKAEGKKTKSIETRIKKSRLDVELTKRTKEYNLGTSLKSYIDPRVYKKWARSIDFDLDKFYPKSLRKKFSWALEGKRSVSETECEST